MLTPQNDPLRFLKPRKKQFHLTPKKGSKVTHKNQQSLQSIRIESDLEVNKKSYIHNTRNQKADKTQTEVYKDIMAEKYLHVSKSMDQQNYNPQKYFAPAVQQYLQQIKAKKYKISPSIQGFKQANSIRNKNSIPNNEYSYQIKQVKSHEFIIPLKEKQLSDPNETTMRLEDYFQTSRDQKDYKKQYKNLNQVSFSQVSYEANSKKQQNRQNNREQCDQNHQINVFSKKVYSKVKNYQQAEFYTQNQNQNEQNNDDEVKFNQQSQNIHNLQTCPTCRRNFNPQSYQKHIKICQKVFFKKRKQFSSQKQRSQSRQKAKAKP